jgi:hypothetical protein
VEQRARMKPLGKLKQCNYRRPIGEFMRDFYKPFIRNKYRQHKFLVAALGTRHCGKHRDPKDLLGCDPDSCCAERDYADRISPEYNRTPMSRGFGGGNGDFGMEGYMYHTVGSNGDVEMHFQTYFAELKQQDARTSFANCRQFIDMLQKRGLLGRGKDSVLYIKSDGCGKQYKCANAIRSMIWLAIHYGFQLDVMVNCAHHGKCLVDAFAGKIKNTIRNGYRVEGAISSAQIDGQTGKRIRETRKAIKYMKDPKHEQPDSKKKQKTGAGAVKTKGYAESDFDKGDYKGDKSNIPFLKSQYKIVDGLPKGKAKTPEARNNGIREMYHFRYHPQMEANQCAVRRIPCLCKNCKTQLEFGSKWDRKEKDAKKQRMFLKPEKGDCYFAPIMGALNDWCIITVDEKTEGGVDVEEENEIVQCALTRLSNHEATMIQKGKFGAINSDEGDAPDGFYMVTWTGTPYTLQEPAIVDCCDEGMMPAGTIVCEGIYWTRVPFAKGWYEPPPPLKPTKYLFWIQHVLKGHIQLEPYKAGVRVPTTSGMRNISADNRRTPNRLQMVPGYTMKDLEFEKDMRARMIIRVVNQDEKELPMEGEEIEVEKLSEVQELFGILD